MIHIQTQKFFERYTGDEHNVVIMFGGINSAGRRYYQVIVDDEFYSNHDSKAQAFDEVVDIIKANGWTSIRPI